MTDLVRYTTDGDIAVITIDNPPVNAIGPGVPEGLASAIEAVEKDPTVKAAVLIGAGKTFIAGADINMFVQMTSGRGGRINLLPYLLQVENCSKPVIVAIHGTAFGGGLELAMAAHYRVAVAGAQLGQPARICVASISDTRFVCVKRWKLRHA